MLKGQPGKWSASERMVLSINEDTGVATASATGRTVVYHKIGGVVDTLTEVHPIRLIKPSYYVSVWFSINNYTIFH